MRKLAQRFPDDPDASVLFAESLLDLHPWDQWMAIGQPKNETPEIVSTLERVLEKHPDHPGACHYYIHAIEASPEPERALPCAERLAGLMPGAGHLVHMPAHIYIRLGMYDKAAEQNEHAAATDESYIADQQPDGIYPIGYYSHNLHFLSVAAMMEGRSSEAIDAARRLAANVTPDVARQIPPLEQWTAFPYLVLVRFGRWQEILDEAAPPSDLAFTTAVWHYARGMALAGSGRLDEAAGEKSTFDDVARAIPAERVVGSFHKAADLLRIASDVLGADIAVREKHQDEAEALLRDAVQIQDGLRYDEPPAWPVPVRQQLGAVLLRAGKPAEAEALYHEDLKRNPNNGWSLHGLAEALKAQGKTKEAAESEASFRKAWERADVQLTAAAF
jgi:tetratricopeptide (TPR) repeat protein